MFTPGDEDSGPTDKVMWILSAEPRTLLDYFLNVSASTPLNTSANGFRTFRIA